MNLDKLKIHIKLCKRNLKSTRVKCCNNCPFEEEILRHYPALKILFNRKRLRSENERTLNDRIKEDSKNSEFNEEFNKEDY
jgi:hypothetical protein